MAGSAKDGEDHAYAFLFLGGTMYNLGSLGGNYSKADAINNAGEVVGVSALVSGAFHAFRYDAGLMYDLGTFGGRW